MEESAKLRMNLVAIQKVDPYAKEILDSCPHVAYYKYISNEWQKSEIEGMKNSFKNSINSNFITLQDHSSSIHVLLSHFKVFSSIID